MARFPGTDTETLNVVLGLCGNSVERATALLRQQAAVLAPATPMVAHLPPRTAPRQAASTMALVPQVRGRRKATGAKKTAKEGPKKATAKQAGRGKAKKQAVAVPAADLHATPSFQRCFKQLVARYGHGRCSWPLGGRQTHARLACCMRVLRCDRFGHTISKSLIRDALTACQGNKLQAEAALKELVPEQYADAVAIAAAVEEGKSQSSRRRLADELRASRARGAASKADASGAGKAGGIAGHELVATLFVAPAVTPVEEMEAKGGSEGGVRTGTSPWFFDEAAERSAQAALRRLCSCGAYASASGHVFKCGGMWACCVRPQSGALGALTLCPCVPMQRLRTTSSGREAASCMRRWRRATTRRPRDSKALGAWLQGCMPQQETYTVR